MVVYYLIMMLSFNFLSTYYFIFLLIGVALKRQTNASVVCFLLGYFFSICELMLMPIDHHVYRGEPKCWYGVPGTEASAFEQVILWNLYMTNLQHVAFTSCLPRNLQ